MGWPESASLFRESEPESFPARFGNSEDGLLWQRRADSRFAIRREPAVNRAHKMPGDPESSKRGRDHPDPPTAMERIDQIFIVRLFLRRRFANALRFRNYK